MTLNIVWRPSKEADTRLDMSSVSTFLDMMGEVGYRVPCTLDVDDRGVLHAMSIVFRRMCDENNSKAPNPFEQLVDLIDRHDSIDLNTGLDPAA